MKRIVFVLSCGLLGVALSGRAIPRQSNGQWGIPADKKLVIALRLLNTEQYNYLDRNHRFADRHQMLSYLREQEPGLLRKLPIDLEDQTSYELAITTSTDGQHYQITLQRTAAPDDKTAACQNAAFSDDKGLIYSRARHRLRTIDSVLIPTLPISVNQALEILIGVQSRKPSLFMVTSH